jgi:hypothetical protein
LVAPSDADWSTASGSVEAEHWLSKDSRIDIYARGLVKESAQSSAKTWQLAIEAKIYSEETDGQIQRYNDLMGQGLFDLSYGIYLSCEGTPPQKLKIISRKDGKECRWLGMSYTQLASLLLRHSIRNSDTESDSRVMLSLFISSLLSDIQGYILPLDRNSWSQRPYTTLKLFSEIESDENRF